MTCITDLEPLVKLGTDSGTVNSVGRLYRASDRSAGQVAFRSRMFLSAYTLLFVLLAIRFDVAWLEIMCFALAAAGILEAVRLVFWFPHRIAAYSYKVEKVEDAGGMVNGFLASHLLPFLAPGTPTARDLAAYVVFFTVLLIVAVNSNLAHINPLLYLFGRRVVRITVAEDSRILVCKAAPRVGDEVRAVRVAGGLVEAPRGGSSDSGGSVG